MKVYCLSSVWFNKWLPDTYLAWIGFPRERGLGEDSCGNEELSGEREERRLQGTRSPVWLSQYKEWASRIEAAEAQGVRGQIPLHPSEAFPELSVQSPCAQPPPTHTHIHAHTHACLQKETPSPSTWQLMLTYQLEGRGHMWYGPGGTWIRMGQSNLPTPRIPKVLLDTMRDHHQESQDYSSSLVFPRD